MRKYFPIGVNNQRFVNIDQICYIELNNSELMEGPIDMIRLCLSNREKYWVYGEKECAKLLKELNLTNQ